MRSFSIFMALILSALIAVQFSDGPGPERPFENLVVVMICGGMSEGSYSDSLREGMEAAQRDLGCTVDPRFTQWNREMEASEFQQAISRVPAGIVLMGYPTHDELMPLIAEAREQEITVTSVNSTFDAAERRYGREGFGYAGLNGFEAGYQLVRAAIRKHALQPGETGLLLGDLEHPSRAAIRDGCLAAFDEGGLAVERLTASTSDLRSSTDAISDSLREMKASGTLPAVLCLTEPQLRTVVEALEAAGLEPGELPLIGIGGSIRSNTELLSGSPRYVSLLVHRDLALEVYLSIVQACTGSVYKSAGLHINTPFEILGDDTLDRAMVGDGQSRFIQTF